MLAEASSQGSTFKPNDVITLYGGALLTERQAREKESEPGGHDYMLRISAKDGSALAFVDGRQFAVGLSQEPDADGLYLPLPDPDDPEARDARGRQGAGSVVNDPTLIINASDKVNAAFKFYQLGRGEQAKLLPRVPVVVATKHIEPGEEIFVRYGTDKPFLGDAVAAGTKRPRDETAPRQGDAGPSEAAGDVGGHRRRQSTEAWRPKTRRRRRRQCIEAPPPPPPTRQWTRSRTVSRTRSCSPSSPSSGG